MTTKLDPLLAPLAYLGLTKPIKFTLTFDGILPAVSRGNTRQKEKWAIRRSVHMQLAELWSNSLLLSHFMRYRFYGYLGDLNRFVDHPPGVASIPPNVRHETTVDLMEPIVIGNVKFIPLIRESLSLICGLKIIFLRKQEAGHVLHNRGDIDNRLKTLFDGLSLPNKDQMVEFDTTSDPQPFYCLLENDNLIDELSIETDRLASAATNKENEVRLIIQVTTKITIPRLYNIIFSGQ